MFFHPLAGGAALGPLEPWHAEEFAAVIVGAHDHLASWIPIPHVVTDVDSARAYLQRRADDHAADTRHCYGIWLDGALVGGAMFAMFDAPNRVCELGAWLVPQAQGRGLVTDAARALIDWAFRVRGMRRVAWHNDPRNGRSEAVARRLGLVFEGRLRSAHVNAGEQQDIHVWSILDSEWPA